MSDWSSDVCSSDLEAARRGLSLAQLNELSQTDESVDRKLDELQLELLRRGGVILERRMARWLARHHRIDAFTVRVECEIGRAARRVRVCPLWSYLGVAVSYTKQMIIDTETL